MTGSGKMLTPPGRCPFFILIPDQGNMQANLARYESTLEMDAEARAGRRFGNGQLKTFSFQPKKQLRMSNLSTCPSMEWSSATWSAALTSSDLQTGALALLEGTASSMLIATVFESVAQLSM